MQSAVKALVLACALLAAAAVRAEVPYEVTVTRTDGAEDSLLSDDPLLSTIRDASELVGLADRVPQSPATLRSRMETDADRLIRVLRAEGYYDGTVEITADALPRTVTTPSETGEDAEAETPEPIQVRITVTPGTQYSLRTYDIDNAHPYGTPFPVPVDLADIEIALGDAATGERIVRAQNRLTDLLADEGRPFAQVVDRLVIADHEARAVDVTLTVDAGPQVRFGPLQIEGLDEVEAELIRDRVEWTEGDVYDQRVVDETRTALAQLEVFSSVSIAPTEDWVENDSRVPMRVNVSERDHRTIGGGIRYSTTDGPGGRLYWQHRNLFGEAERLELELSASQRLYEFGAEYTDNSLFQDVRYTFTADSRISYELSEAYESQSFENAVGVSYAHDEELTLSGGVRTAISNVDEGEGTDRFVLVGLPLALDYDLRDNSFNPTGGTLSRLTLEPLLIAPDPSLVALRTTLYQTGYWAPLDDDSIVLAGWGQIGATFGADADTLPADERFYVGGGGSVRGFAHQFAGDIDDEGDPVGGQSMVALGAETRFRFLEDYGAVLFLEGGRSFADAIPTFDAPLFWGAGIGARYYTDFGPVRLDFAVPLNGRSGIDDGFQFYISFGQAF